MEEVSKICNEENNIFGVSFSTNLVASWRRIERFLESTSIAKLGIGCTLHDTVIRDADLFFDKVKRLKEKGVMLYVGYVATPERISFIREYKKRCDAIGVPLTMNSLIGPGRSLNGANQALYYPRDYTDEQKAELKEVWDTPHSYNLLVESCSTRGMPCSAGKNYIFIDHKGDVFPCGSVRDKRPMGNILKEEY
jgi:MoaA/NifB/PqqE/SkfB family radical SAM enzyme